MMRSMNPRSLEDYISSIGTRMDRLERRTSSSSGGASTDETIFTNETFTVKAAGTQRYILKHTPLPYSEHVYWNTIYQPSTEYTRTGTRLDIPDPDNKLRIGDKITIEYAYLPTWDDFSDRIDFRAVTPYNATYVGWSEVAGPGDSVWSDGNDATYARIPSYNHTDNPNFNGRVEAEVIRADLDTTWTDVIFKCHMKCWINASHPALPWGPPVVSIYFFTRAGTSLFLQGGGNWDTGLGPTSGPAWVTFDLRLVNDRPLSSALLWLSESNKPVDVFSSTEPVSDPGYNTSTQTYIYESWIEVQYVGSGEAAANA